MVSFCPLRIGLWDPFQIAFYMAEINGGDPITTETKWDASKICKVDETISSHSKNFPRYC